MRSERREQPFGSSVLPRVSFHDKQHGPVDTSQQDPAVTWLTQVHGARVVVVDEIGAHAAAPADAAVTAVVGAKLLIRTADCAPVLFVGTHLGRTVGVGVAHAGWKGLLAGILPATVGALCGLGASVITAALYPCIGPECYEFGRHDLDAAAVSLGPSIRSNTTGGQPALDLVESVRSSLKSAGVDSVDTRTWSCTACDETRFFSYRARREHGRLGLYAWLEDSPPDV